MSVAMVGAAAVSVGGSLLAAKGQSKAAQQAADTSSDAAKYSADLQKQMYDQTRADQSPWRNTGAASLNKLSYLLGLPSNAGQSAPQVESRESIYNRLKGSFSTGGNQSGGDLYGGQLTPPAFPGMYNGSSFFGPNTTWFNEDWMPASNTQPVAQAYDTNALNAAVDAEYARQQAAYNSFNSQPDNSNDPAYGSLLRPFSLADFQADPSYLFRQSEGEKGINRSLASRGRYTSGAALKELNRYNSDLASQEYGNAFNRHNINTTNTFNRLASIAGVGQTANNQLQSAGQQYANNTGNLMMTSAANQGNAALAGANAQASGYAGLGSALGNIRWGQGGSQPSTGYGGGYDPTTGLGNTSVNWGY